VGSRDQTTLVDGVLRQVELVEDALDDAGYGDIPVTGMLCFVEGNFPVIGGDFSISGVLVLWPSKAESHIRKPGFIDSATAQDVHRALALAFPSA
jgi:hypothetical protein